MSNPVSGSKTVKERDEPIGVTNGTVLPAGLAWLRLACVPGAPSSKKVREQGGAALRRAAHGSHLSSPGTSLLPPNAMTAARRRGGHLRPAAARRRQQRVERHRTEARRARRHSEFKEA